jgi:uncharacterized membrane protein
MAKLEDIRKDVIAIKNHLIEKEPDKFSIGDLIDSFFGALILGLTFALKGLLIQIGSALTNANVIAIIITTVVILTAEIYFIGYKRVRVKKERPFGQFWLKRILAFYAVAFVVASLLVYIYGIPNLPGVTTDSILRIIVAISMPCAIGAAIGDLLKRY